MKKSAIALSVVGLLHGACLASGPVGTEPVSAPADEAMEITSDTDKINYSLGYELGEDFKRQDLGLTRDALLRGVEDAISGARPLVDARGRQVALKAIKEKRNQENLDRSLAFLAANAKKEGVTTLPSGLQYKELKPGEGKTPTTDSKVTVNYRGTLVDGTEFAISYGHGKPSTFLVRRVIKGWSEGLQLMKEGAKWELYIPPELAYGKRSPRNRIPPNSALIYEVELLSIDEAPPPEPRRTGLPVPPAAEGASTRDDVE